MTANKKQVSISSKGTSKGAKNANSQRTENEIQDNTGKRRKVGMACIYCRRSHMTCDEGRPCKRW